MVCSAIWELIAGVRFVISRGEAERITNLTSAIDSKIALQIMLSQINRMQL